MHKNIQFRGNMSEPLKKNHSIAESFILPKGSKILHRDNPCIHDKLCVSRDSLI